MNPPPHIPSPGTPMQAVQMRDLSRAIQAATPVPGKVKVRRLAGGSIADYTPEPPLRQVQRRLPWEVYQTGAAAFTVAAGLLINGRGYALTNPAGYSATVTGTGTTKVYVQYNLGDETGTLTEQAPQWIPQLVSSVWYYVHSTASALDDDGGRLRNILIADVAHTSGAITSITQYHLAGAIPCPEPYAETGEYAWFNVPPETNLFGWRYIGAAEGRTIIGATDTIAEDTTGGTLTLPVSNLEAATGTGVTFKAPDSDAIPRQPYLALCLYQHLIPL